MSAAPSAACDIWSLGCTILELTTGKPPHFDLAPMAALFRIVQDDIPRLPSGVSKALRDFLLRCFNREAALRADARGLLSHAWLQYAPVRPSRPEMQEQDSCEPTGTRTKANKLMVDVDSQVVGMFDRYRENEDDDIENGFEAFAIESTSRKLLNHEPLLDPFAFGSFKDDADFIHGIVRERASKRREGLDLLLFELAMPVRKEKAPVLPRLLRILKAHEVGHERALSEIGATSLVEGLRSPGCVIEALQVTHTVLFCSSDAANILAEMGIAPLLLALIPAINGHQVLNLLGAILNIFCFRCTELSLRSFLFSGGLQLAVELLVSPNEEHMSMSRCTAAALAGATLLQRTLDAKRPKVLLQGPSRIALCRVLALRDAPAKLATTLEASLQTNISPDRCTADVTSRALAALSDADTVTKETIAAPRTATVVLRILAAFPKRVSDAWDLGVDGDADAALAVRLLKALKVVCMSSAAALDSLAACGAIETVVGVLEVAQAGASEINGFIKKAIPRRDDLEDQLVPIVYYLCRIEHSRLARAARCGAAMLLAVCVARRRHLRQFALAILCELCHVAANDEQGDIGAELWRGGGVRLYIRLLAETYWCVRALAALNSWLKADTLVEAAMAEPHCAQSIVHMFHRLDGNEFEQILEPLLDACETSPCIVRALLSVHTKFRHRFIIDIGEKLEKHTSAIIRKKLLEILRSVLSVVPAPVILLLATRLDNVLVSILTDDDTANQVLVINLTARILHANSADRFLPPAL